MQLKRTAECSAAPVSGGRQPNPLDEGCNQPVSWQEGTAGFPCLFQNQMAANRYRRELAWIKELPNLSSMAAALLAARAAACMMAINQQDYGSTPSDGWISSLVSARFESAALEVTARELLPHTGVVSALSQSDLASINALWPLIAPVETLLASGGDDRLTVDPATGLNRYGCTPWPRPEVISFASCTASNLSEGAFDAAELARRALVATALKTSPASALAGASEAIASAVAKHYEVGDLADAILAASGTDAALLVTGLLSAERPGEALTSIMVCPSETGSGVPDAVQGRHFASCTANGSLVGKGTPIDGLAFGPALVTVALRDEIGSPRLPAKVDEDFEDAIRTGVAFGHVVLHAIDGSKTGLTAPDREVCKRLSQKYGSNLDIVIDACQARIEPALVRWYLQQGFPVLVTGSKFFSCPGFCGAVLFPRERLHRITRAGRLPAGLAAYARLQDGFGSRRCPGLVLRWTAALHEMAIFGRVPAQLVSSTLDRMGRAVTDSMSGYGRLQLVAAPRPPGMGWSDRQSVFTFAVHGAAGLMSMDQLRKLYADLSEDCSAVLAGGDQRCQVGQPVQIGRSAMCGLRIALSSGHITSGSDQSERLMLVLEKIGGLLDRAA